MQSLFPLLVPVGYLAYISFRLSKIDFEEHRLPNQYTLRLFALSVPSVCLAAVISQSWERLISATLLLLLVLSVGISLSYLGGLGMGDVKLMASLTLVSSYLSPWLLLISNFTAAITASIWGLWERAKNEKGPSQLIPLGPFLILGFFTAIGYSLVFKVY